MAEVDTRREYLSIAEVAHILGVSRRTVERKLDAGELSAAKLGKQRTSLVRIPSAALRAFVGEDDAA